jgi:hypothetical protein
MKREAAVEPLARKGGSRPNEPRRPWHVFAYRRPAVPARRRFTT